MPEIDRLDKSIEWIDLSFVEHDRTPRWGIEVGIRCHLVGMSLRGVSQFLGELGIDRSHVVIHNWMHKAELQPAATISINLLCDGAPDSGDICRRQERLQRVIFVCPLYYSSKHVAHSVLIVDDDERLRKLLELKLRKRFAVESCEHGRAAMEYLETNAASPPDAVILDVMMPGVDGFQLLDWITKDDRFEDLTVIMLTARGKEDDAVKALENGATDFLTKPLAANELIARIEHSLG